MSDLFALASRMSDLTGGTGLPPVDKWNPEYCGEIDMVIRKDGLWFHEGSPIGRPQLVRLFSTVLKREEDDYFLVTPVEKLKIVVEDVPFLAVEMTVQDEDTPDQQLTFRTNVGDDVIAGPDHALAFRAGEAEDELVPYLHVRRGLEARLSRPVYYQLAELVRSDPPVVVSNGATFPFGNPSAATGA
ncbi:DUF1285 domain-containing protein [Parvularcula sp. IMCC14364]|uniref:DUF1285 domain-containing protein n=1 Tax=Parvularcula sp. IMCC14364 TaxID=3067902 RepID=UPI002740417C|nr:DUF1285 domain-containing protein [Parvularcula sp. IMCC14364]